MAPRPTSTLIIVAGLLLAVALGAWWWSRMAPRAMDDAATADASRSPASVAGLPVPGDAPVSGNTPTIPASDLKVSRQTATATPDAAGISVLAAGTAAVARPLSAEGERRVDTFLAGLRTASSDAKDYETLGRSEPADPDWSPRLEALIQQVIERHAREFGHLEISKPRCSKSLCMLTAVATTRNPQHVGRTDYQRLVGYMMQEPWFREAFFDASTTVSSDATGNVFVSYFIRK
jgi:hypothetical protein